MNFWYNSLKWTLRIIFALPLYLHYSRLGQIDKNKHIFVSNHMSTLDPLMIMITLPEQISILITGGVFTIPIIGRVLINAGHIPVYDTDKKSAYQKAKNELESGKNILIFPEGQLSFEDGTIKPLFSGAARLAIETKTSIIPIGVSMKKRWLKIPIKLAGKIEYARFYLIGTYRILVGKAFFLNYSEVNQNNKARIQNRIKKEIYKLLTQKKTIVS